MHPRCEGALPVEELLGVVLIGLLQALSIVSMWPYRPVLIAVVGLLAILDTMIDGLEVSLVLGVMHLMIIRWC
jgi:hypothetical protein